jgi:hypothetical protein
MQDMIDFHFQSRLPVLVIFCRGCHPATSAFAFAFGIIGGTGVSDMKKVKPSQIAAKDSIRGPQKASNTSGGFGRVLTERARTQGGDHPVY